MRFEDKGSNIFVSSTLKVRFQGSDREHAVIYRIDGRNVAREGFRVDRGGIMGWEAVDGGTGPKTLRAAKALASRHFDAIVQQGTLTPRT